MRIWRWVAALAAALVLIPAIIWAIGSLLPVQHRAVVSATLPVPADTVWARIDRIEAWPTWRDATVERVSESRVRVREGGQTLVYRVERPAPRTLVTTIDSSDLPFGGRWVWSVRPDSDGSSTVTIVEEGEVHDPFFRFFSRFVFGHESTLRDVLGRLEASFDRPS